MEEGTLGTPPFRRTLETERLIESLGQMKPGESRVDSDVMAECGITSPAQLSGSFQTATKHLRKIENGGKVFRRENHQIACLTDEQKIDAQHRLQRTIHRTACRQTKELVTVDYQGLNDDQKRRHCALASIAGALATMTSAPSRKKIASRIQASAERLPVAATLGAFLADAKNGA